MYQKFSNFRIIHELRYLFYPLAILTLHLFYCQTAIASPANRGYVPPADRKSTTTQRRQASGSRGCGLKENSISLELLKPQNSDFSMLEIRPIVVFDISAIPENSVIVTLTQPNEIEPIFETEIEIDRPGVWSINNESEVSLLENQQYVVTVLLACNNSDLSQGTYIRFLYNPI